MKCQEMITIQQEIYYTFNIIIKIIINSMVFIYQSKKKMSTPRQVHFMGELEEDGVTMLFFSEKQQKTECRII